MDMRPGSQHVANMLMQEPDASFLERLASDDQADGDAKWYTQYLIESGQFPYYVNPDGSTVSVLDAEVGKRVKTGAVAVLPIKGVMVKEAWYVEELVFGLCSSERIAEEMRMFQDDARVAGIVLKPYTPGGMVYGTEAVGESVKAAAAAKPVIACVDHMACSAGYWDIANATEIRLMGKTSEVGSIGVVRAWMDLIGIWEKMGATWRMHFAPESNKKWEEYRELLEKDNPKVLEGGMSPTAQLFQQVVREGRQGKLNTKDDAVLAGRVYEGDAAIAAGLADGYGTLQECIDAVRRQAGVSVSRSTGRRADSAPTPTDNHSETDNNPNMSKIAKVVAALAAALGFDNKEEVTSQNIKEANEALKEKGITAAAFVVTAEVERLATAAQQVAEANEAKAAAEQAKATAESAKAAAECALATANTEKSVAEGKATAATDALAAVEAKLKDAATKANLEVKDGENATDVVINALSAATARVTELEAQVTTLKGEEAPDSRPGGVVNKEGDTRDATKDDTLSELDNLVKIDDED
jgi:ClpP class serine protease